MRMARAVVYTALHIDVGIRTSGDVRMGGGNPWYTHG